MSVGMSGVSSHSLGVGARWVGGRKHPASCSGDRSEGHSHAVSTQPGDTANAMDEVMQGYFQDLRKLLKVWVCM